MDLTPFEWVKVVASIASVVLAVAVYVWGRDRAIAISDAVGVERFQRIQADFEAIHLRFDKAGQKTSDEANRIMGKINAMDLRLARVEQRLNDGGIGMA